MRLLTKQIPASCEIALHGDTHEGNLLSRTEGVDSLIEWVMAKRNRYFVHMGDEIEAITSDDKRFQSDTTTDPIPMMQSQAAAERYAPAAARCLTWLNGNHNNKLARFGNLTATLCAKLGIPYGTWTCKLRLMTGDHQVCKMFLTHGFRGTIRSRAKDEEQRRANMMASLKMLLVRKASDCLIMGMGHTHLLMVVPPARRLILRDDGTDMHQQYLGQGDGAADYIEPDRRWYVNTGSFLGLYADPALEVDGYAERAGYDPTEMGHVLVTIRSGKVATVEPVVMD